MISEIIDLGMSYVHIGTTWVRDLITKLIGFTGFDGRLGTIILMLILSAWLGHLVAKRFVTRTWSGTYFVWTSLISLLWFLILMYI
jgi:hypothetical protein